MYVEDIFQWACVDCYGKVGGFESDLGLTNKLKSFGGNWTYQV